MAQDSTAAAANAGRPRRTGPLLRAAAFGIAVLAAAAAAWFWFNRPPPADHADVAYGKASAAQKLDIYLPGGKGPFPVVVFAHGGAFQFGSKREYSAGFRQNIAQLREAGIAMVSIDYRMAGEATFPAAVQDMKSAVRHLRANAARYRLDPERIAVWGKSAGGHIALMTALTEGAPLFDDPAAGTAAVSGRVSAAVSMYGPTDFLAMDAQLAAAGCPASDQTHSAADSPESKYLGGQITARTAQAAQSNPLTYVSASSPPLMLLHGSADCTVPPGQSTVLRVAAARVMPAERIAYAIIPGAVHGDSVFESDAEMAKVIAFLKAAFAAEAR